MNAMRYRLRRFVWIAPIMVALIVGASAMAITGREDTPVVTATAQTGSNLIAPLLSSPPAPPSPTTPTPIGASNISPVVMVTPGTIPDAASHPGVTDTPAVGPAAIATIVPNTPRPLPTRCVPDPTPTPAGGTNCISSTVIADYLASSPQPPYGGVPAIPPRYPNTAPQFPSFIADDAAAYVLAHPYFGRAEASGPIAIARVEFLTSDDLVAKYHVNQSGPPGQLLCIVIVSGTFSVSGPPIANGDGTTVARATSYQSAFAIFDAHSGNILTVGAGLPQ